MQKTPANVNLTIDGRAITVPDGTRLIEAARRLGIDIPHYCYHPSLSIAGSCRMCLVEIEGMRKMALACDTLAREGMVVRTNTPQVADARRGMVEFFLINHPLDCPVCDRGGECMLHRYDMDYGPSHTRTVEPRLRFRKPQLDPLLDLERNRCVLCTRCVRFVDEIAGERAIGVFERGDSAYIATFENRPIRTIFSGMIIDLCPVGTWTSKPFRFTARVWELQQVQATCPYCSSGCPVTLWMRAGRVHRVTPLSSPEWKANFQIFYDGRDVICNQGRFGCDFANRPDRLTRPSLRKADGRPAEAGWDEALNEAARRLNEVRASHGPDAIGLIASSRATCEEMYLLQRLGRQVIGTNNVDWRVGLADGPAAMAYSQAFSHSTGHIEELDRYDVVLVINADLITQVPVVALKIKEAARLKNAQVFVLDHRFDGWLSRYAQGILHCPIQHTEHVIAALERKSAVAAQPLLWSGQEVLDPLIAAIGSAKTGLIVFGLDGCSGLSATRSVNAVTRLAASLGSGWEMLPVVPERNATGAFAVGCQPDRLPGGWSDDAGRRSRLADLWGSQIPATPGLTAPEMIEAARAGRLKALYVLGAGDFHAHPWLDSILAALENLDLLIVHDVFASPLSDRAHIVLPGAFFSEKDGTLLDVAGWPDRLSKGWPRPEGVQDDAAVLDVLAQKMGATFGYRDVDAVYAEMMQMLNPACPLKGGELCAVGPGEEWPVRCLNVPVGRARLNPGKFYTVCPTYLPACRIILGAPPQPAAAAIEAEEFPEFPEGLRLLWSWTLRGSDHLGDRSEIMGPLRDPDWMELHPYDARRLGLNDGDRASVAGEGVTASGQIRLNAKVSPGFVYVPQNAASMQFAAPPGDLPLVTIAKIAVADTGTNG